MKKIVAICGSTRQNSINLELLQIIQKQYAGIIDIQIFTEIAYLPHFNPDLDNPENTPTIITEYRNLLKSADALLICTPEYAMGVPGTLKNALDWTVSSMEFSHKSTALITASTLGEKAHKTLLETLKIIEAKINETRSLLISLPKTKIKDSKILDKTTDQAVNFLIESLVEGMGN